MADGGLARISGSIESGPLIISIMINRKAIISIGAVLLLLSAITSCSAPPVNSNFKELFVQGITLADRKPEVVVGGFGKSDRRAKTLVEAMNRCAEMRFLKIRSRYRVIMHYEDGTERRFLVRGKYFQAIVGDDLIPYECQEDLEPLITSLTDAPKPD